MYLIGAQRAGDLALAGGPRGYGGRRVQEMGVAGWCLGGRDRVVAVRRAFAMRDFRVQQQAVGGHGALARQVVAEPGGGRRARTAPGVVVAGAVRVIASRVSHATSLTHAAVN